MALVDAYIEELEKLKNSRDEFYNKLINNRNEVAKQLELEIYYDIEDQTERNKQIEENLSALQAEMESKTDAYGLKITELEKVIEKMKQTN